MNNGWLRAQETFNAMPGRQRALLSLASFLMITLPLMSYVISPTLEQSKALSVENTRIASQIEQSEQLEQDVQAQLANDIDAPLRAEIKQLKQRLAQAKGDFSQSQVLLPAQQRKQFLKSVLRFASELGMDSLEAKEPTVVFETGSIKLYQHAVQAEFTGRFFAISDFVDTLQKEYPNVQWARFDYQVGDYPTATVTIVWYLLSTDKEFISA
ncbi:Type II secretory pathway component [Idiomarina aminovorans]|uniref:Type II secretory pathway component n=1 Tax=Idiomarina aminovorans TaxID=2914829 RepID=UPI0020057245|nr:Type II secretory pathway component [Idiomarina sp. ATCH4]MCK7458957.1 Type II secretory pathway component [Idiomarina sp. ATCH4]